MLPRTGAASIRPPHPDRKEKNPTRDELSKPSLYPLPAAAPAPVLVFDGVVIIKTQHSLEKKNTMNNAHLGAIVWVNNLRARVSEEKQ